MGGVTRRGNENFISYVVLEHCIRKDLDNKAPRTMAVLDPIKLIIDNIAADELIKFEVPDFPKDPTRGHHTVTLSKVVFVERNDCALIDTPEHFGLAPNKYCGLKYAGHIFVKSVLSDSNN